MIVTKIELSNFRNYDSLSLELDDKTNSKQIKKKEEQVWLAKYQLTGSIPLTVSQIMTDKRCTVSEARSILNNLLKKD